MLCVFFFKQKTAYEMRISDWSSDVCSSDLGVFTNGDGNRAIVVPYRHIGEQFGPVKLLQRLVQYRPVITIADLQRHIGTHGLRLQPFRPRDRDRPDRPLHVRHGGRGGDDGGGRGIRRGRSEEHTSELQSLMRTSYAVFCLKKTIQ